MLKVKRGLFGSSEKDHGLLNFRAGDYVLTA